MVQLAKDETVANLASLFSKSRPQRMPRSLTRIRRPCGQRDLLKDPGAGQDDVGALRVEAGHLRVRPAWRRAGDRSVAPGRAG